MAKITRSDIVSGARFKANSGTIFIVDSIENDPKFGTLVNSSIEGGAKGNYRDSISDFVDFMNEMSATKIMARGGVPKGLQQKRNKVGQVMHEFKEGKLHSGSRKGPIVTDRDQAIAIALSEAGMSKKMENGGSTYADGGRSGKMPLLKIVYPTKRSIAKPVSKLMDDLNVDYSSIDFFETGDGFEAAIIDLNKQKNGADILSKFEMFEEKHRGKFWLVKLKSDGGSMYADGGIAGIKNVFNEYSRVWSKKAVDNIYKIAEQLGATEFYDYSSGGGFYHIALLLPDKKVAIFSNEDETISLSKKKYDNLEDDYYNDEDYLNTGYYPDVALDEDYKNVSQIVKAIKDEDSWLWAYGSEEEPQYMDGGSMYADGGGVSKYSVDEYDLEKLQSSGVTINQMNEILKKSFPDSFGFTLYPVKDDSPSNYRHLIPNTDDYYGIKDASLKISFNRYHGMSYRVYQGGENTYFYFILDGSDGNGYIGSFGFKDQGDVPKEYVTSFTALLNKLYGFPFQVSHEVYADGGWLSSFNPKSFTLDELKDYLWENDIYFSGFQKGWSGITPASQIENLWDGTSHSLVLKKWKDKKLTISDYGHLEFEKGSENLYLDLIVYELDGSDDPYTIRIYTKENHKGLKEFANHIIDKFKDGGSMYADGGGIPNEYEKYLRGRHNYYNTLKDERLVELKESDVEIVTDWIKDPRDYRVRFLTIKTIPNIGFLQVVNWGKNSLKGQWGANQNDFTLRSNFTMNVKELQDYILSNKKVENIKETIFMLPYDDKKVFDDFAKGGSTGWKHKMAKGGSIKVGDRVRSTTFKGVSGTILSKNKNGYYFVRLDEKLPNGDYQHDVLRIDEVEKMSAGGSADAYIDVTEIKGDLLKDPTFMNLLLPTELPFIRKSDTKIFKLRTGWYFTDGKREIVFNSTKPFSKVKKIGNASSILKEVYSRKIMSKGGSAMAVNVPVSERLRKVDIDQFIEYVNSVYGKDEDAMGKDGYTKAQIKTAINKYVSDLGNEFTWGYGDSLDRERVFEYLKNPKQSGIVNPSFARGGSAGGGRNRKAPFKVGDMVYSYQNPNHQMRVSFVEDRGVIDGVDYGWGIKVALKTDAEGNYDPQGTYSKSSKWMSQNSVSKTKKEKYDKGGALSSFNPKSFTLDELKDYLWENDIYISWFQKGWTGITPASQIENLWSGTSHSLVLKKWKDKKLTISDYGQLEFSKGDENLYLTLIVYQLGGSDDPYEIRIYTKDNHQGLKEFANHIIDKFKKGGSTGWKHKMATGGIVRSFDDIRGTAIIYKEEQIGDYVVGIRNGFNDSRHVFFHNGSIGQYKSLALPLNFNMTPQLRKEEATNIFNQVKKIVRYNKGIHPSYIERMIKY